MECRAKRRSSIVQIFFLIGFFLSPCVLAATTAGQAAFSSGVSLFRQGRYANARAAFEKALAEGLRTPALFYDLGATEFKLGNLEAAKRNFKRISGDPRYGQYARYNLGLVARKQGDSAAARTYFSYVSRRASDPSLRELAHRQLKELGPVRNVPKGVGFLELESGYDSNVILRRLASTVTPSQKGSALFGILTGGSGLLYGSWNHGLQWTGSVFYRGYTAVGGYDQLLFQTGPKYRFPWGGWQWETAAELSYFRFGGATLETTAGVRAKASHSLGSNGTLSFDGGVSKANGGSNYAYLGGHAYFAGLKGEWALGSTTFSVAYDHRVERRNGLQTGTQYFDVSPTSDRLVGAFDWAFAKHWSAGIRADYTHSRYQNPDVYTQNATLVTVQRVDDYSSLGLSVKRDLSKALYLELSAEHDNNSSTVARYTYAQNVYLLRLSYLF